MASAHDVELQIVMSYNFVTALAFLVWDICITTDREINLIWNQPRNTPWIAYSLIRYVPLLSAMSSWPVGSTAARETQFSYTACSIWQVWSLLAGMITMASLEYILLLRVRALYYRYPRIKMAVSILYVVDVLCMVVGSAVSISRFKSDRYCDSPTIPASITLYGAATPLFHSVLFILTNVMFWRAVRAEWGRGRTLELLMRDGTWAFFLFKAFWSQMGYHSSLIQGSLSSGGCNLRCQPSVSALILNLRHEFETAGSAESSDLPCRSALVFAKRGSVHGSEQG